MKRVLIITYYWPPAGGVSVQRVLKFCKYLPEFDIQPYVLTVENGSFASLDMSLNQEVSPLLKVYKTKTIEPFTIYNFLRGKNKNEVSLVEGDVSKKSLFQKIGEFIRANIFIPDARVGWNLYARKKALEILDNEQIDIVITTGPPHSTHLIGLYLKHKRHIKWIADFRDPWVELFATNFLPRTRFSVWLDRILENKIISKADKIVLIGKQLFTNFSLDSNKEKVSVISNGYDFDITNFSNSNRDSENYFTIRYVGTFFKSQNIPSFWKSISSLLNSRPQLKDKIRIELIGKIDDFIKSEIEKYGLTSICTYINFLSHKEAIDLVSTASCLLLVVPNVDNNKSIITGKLFEYLGAKKPILCFAPEDSEAVQIVKDANAGYHFDYDNDENLESVILDLIASNGNLTYYGVEKYHRKQLTAQLAAIIHSK